MRRFLTTLLTVFACFALPAFAAQEEFVLVFSAEARQVEVFHAGDLSLRASLKLAHAPVAAFADVRGDHAQIYIVTTRSIVIVDEDWTSVGAIDLPGDLSAGATPAAISLGKLAVLTGDRLVVIDTASNQIEAVVDLPASASDVVADKAGNFRLTSRHSAAVQTLDRETLELRPSVGVLPTAPTALSYDPLSGQLYAASRGALHLIDGLPNLPLAELANLAAPAKAQAGRPIDGFVVTNAGRYYMLSGDRVFFGLMREFGEQRELADPRTGMSFQSPLAGIAPNGYGDTVFVALSGENQLVAVSPNSPGEFQTASLTVEPSGVSVVAPRISILGTLGLITENNAFIAGGQQLEITVEALNDSAAPIADLGIFVSNVFPVLAAATCLPAITGPDGRATIRCEMVDTTVNVNAQITVTTADGVSAPLFRATIVPPTDGDGIFAVEGDGQEVPIESEFSIVVLVSRNRRLASGVVVVVTVEEGDPATCPPIAVTGADGQAVITCTAGLVAGPRFADITVTEEGTENAVSFRVSVDPTAPIPNGLTKVSGDNQSTFQGRDFPEPLVISNFRNGEPRRNVRMNTLTVSTEPIVCPVFVFTDDEGLTSFICKAKNLTPGPGGLPEAVLVTVRASDAFGRRLRDPFTLFVTSQGARVANAVELLTPSDLDDLLLSTLHTDAIKVRALASGKVSPNTPVFFWTDQELATIEPAMAVTNAFGEVSASITVGCTFQGKAKFFIGLDATDALATVSFNGDFGPLAQLQIERGDNQRGVPRQRLDRNALVVRTLDACGRQIDRQPVSWQVNPDHMANLEQVRTMSDSNARASAIARLRDHGGPFTVTARSGDLVATFNLETVLEPTQLRKRAGDGQNVGANRFAGSPLIAELLGNNGFGVGGVPVTFAVTQGAATLLSPTSETDGLGLAFTRIQVGPAGGAVVVEARAIGQLVTFFINGGGEPAVTLSGFVDGASFLPGWVPGSLASIFGVNLIEAEGIFFANAVPFATVLEGVSVSINGTPAPIVSMANVNGQEQINLQVPFGTAVGNVEVSVDNNGSVGTFDGIPVVQKKPAIFEFNVEGQRVAAVLHADFRPVTPSDPALPGEVVLLFLTGLGPTTPSVGTNTPGPSSPLGVVNGSVTVGIDNAGMENFGAFYAPGLITAYQINFRVGQDVAAGLRALNVVCDGVGSMAVKIPIGAN